MRSTFDRLTAAFDETLVSRRAMIGALPALALALAPGLLARAQAGPPVRVERLHSFGLGVRDVDRSLEFYQGLFGMQIQARQGETVCLRIGNGPQFVSLRGLEPGENPSITHMCYSTPDFDADRILEALSAEGIERIDAPAVDSPGIDNAMKAWVRTRRGTPELFFADASGLIVQLQDPSYCGGGGDLGNMCEPTDAAISLCLCPTVPHPMRSTRTCSASASRPTRVRPRQSPAWETASSSSCSPVAEAAAVEVVAQPRPLRTSITPA